MASATASYQRRNTWRSGGHMRDRLSIFLAISLTFQIGFLLGLVVNHPQRPAPQYVPVVVQRQCDDVILYEDGSVVCETDLTRGIIL